MRALTCLFILLLGLSHETVSAQVDFSGVYVSVYVGSPETVILPSTYPFTVEAERAFNDFNPAVDDPRIGNDCAPRRMPALLWSAAEPPVLLRSFEPSSRLCLAMATLWSSKMERAETL